MKHILVLISIVFLAMTFSIKAEPVDAPELTLTQFKRMPGVEVSIDNDSNNSGWTRVDFQLLNNANYLGISDYKTKGPSTMTIFLIVSDGQRQLVRAPLCIERVLAGQGFSGKPKENYSTFHFEIEPKLLSTSSLEFHDRGTRGHTETLILFDTNGDKN